jgi:hypothetical protein
LQGSTFEGEFSNDEIRDGTFIDKNVFTYTGEFNELKRHGKGKMISFKNGTIYEGLWEKDFLINGTVINPNGDEITGTFKNGEIHGIVSLKYKIDGSKYVGTLLNGLKHGKGKLTDKDGNLYEGEWINGFKNGAGMSINSNGD